MFYSKQQYFVQIQKQYKELVVEYEKLADRSLPKELIDLIHHTDFKAEQLKGFIFHYNELAWAGENTQSIDIKFDDFESILETVKDKMPYTLITIENYKIIQV